MAISARVDAGKLVVEFDPRSGEGLGALFEAIARISGDYSTTLASVTEIHVHFFRADDVGKIYAWMQGAMANQKIVTVRPAGPQAEETLRKELAAGRQAWTNLLPPDAAKRATKPLMRPTSKVPKPQ
jgi:hypothetical protein